MDARRPHEALLNISVPPLLAYTVLSLWAACYLLKYFDVPILSPQEYFWNALVWTLPEPLLLDVTQRKELRANDMLSQRHAVKSDALRRLLGMGGNALLQNLPSESISLGAVGGMVRRASTSLVGGRNVLATSNIPAGLGNWDNSCYQNSVLQALSSLGSLRSWLPKAEPPNSDAGSTTNTSLQEMITKLRDPSNNGRHIWTPAKLKNMSSWQQQDAQEYFSKVMDELDKDAAKALAARSTKAGLESILDESVSPALDNDDTCVAPRNPLEGLTAQRISCTKCGFSEGFSMIQFNCLTVPLGPKPNYDLEECLDEYTKSEDIEGVECRSCTLRSAQARLKQLELPPELRGQVVSRMQAIERALEKDDFSDRTLMEECQIPAKAYVNSTKSREALIGRAPNSLVIHVNRSVFDEMTGTQRKNYANVQYPMILDMGPWMLGTTNAPVRYRLSAVVTHYGRHENGHYICYRKHPPAQTQEVIIDEEDKMLEDEYDDSQQSWWRLSDEDVSIVSEDVILGQGGVFMLFYERLADQTETNAAERDIDAASVPLPPDEAADWEMVRAETASTATLSQVTSTTESVMSDTDTDATDVDDIPEAKPAVPPTPILKTATPAYMHSARKDMKHGMNINRSPMSV